MRSALILGLIAAIAILPCPAFATRPMAEAVQEKGEEQAGKESPWLLMPTFSSSPKLGTSLGAMAAYMHYFDKESKVSMFGANAQYTSTDSVIGALLAKTSSGADHHRVLALLAGGLIKNDYNDFLGTGKPLKTEDNLQAFVTRYVYRVKDNWFVGGQALLTDYQIIGQNWLDEQILDVLGLTGFRAGGIGLVVQHDSRNNEFSPSAGWYLNVNNVAYRDWIAGQENFDVYRLDIRGYFEHWNGLVLALRESNQWTVDAPASALAPVVLRGYKMGQYLGTYMSSVEAEERIPLAKRWKADLFAGIACLYGDGKECSDSENRYPSFGAGVQYVIKEKEQMVLNLEYAQGKSDNYGVYLKFGYGY